MTFTQSRGGDLDETGLGPQCIDIGRATIAHAGPQAADSVCAVEDLPEVLQDQAAVVALGTATVDGTAVTVWVADTPSGRRVVVVDGNCLAVANRPLG